MLNTINYKTNKMFSQENEFYICLLSSNSMNYYDGNTLSSFTNLLASPCNLNCGSGEGDWKVGLTEVAFNSYFHNTQTRNKRSLDTRFDKMIVVQGETQTTSNGGFTPMMLIPKALSQIPDTVIKSINNNIPKQLNVVEASLTPSVTKRSKINSEPQHSFDIPPSIRTDEPRELGLAVNNSDLNLNYIYIYMDAIKPRYIGDIKSRYLKIIPKLNTHADIIKFDHVEYCSLEKGYIENISILLLDIEGEKINFIGGTSPTYVMLHFKKCI